MKTEVTYSSTIKKEMPKPKAKPRYNHFAHFMLSFFSTCLVVVIAVIFLLYGPIKYFRDELVTKAMATMSHQWIASFLFTKSAISESLGSNKVVELNFPTDPSQITTKGVFVKDNATELPKKASDGEHIIDGIGFIRLEGPTYTGWAVKIYDPSRIYMSLAQGIGTDGEKSSAMFKR